MLDAVPGLTKHGHVVGSAVLAGPCQTSVCLDATPSAARAVVAAGDAEGGRSGRRVRSCEGAPSTPRRSAPPAPPLMAAVVTREDNRQLPTRAQSARPWDDYASDPWLRYRAAGLPVEDVAPVP